MRNVPLTIVAATATCWISAVASPVVAETAVHRPDVGVRFTLPTGYRTAADRSMPRNGTMLRALGSADRGVVANFNLIVGELPQEARTPQQIRRLLDHALESQRRGRPGSKLNEARLTTLNGEQAVYGASVVTANGREIRQCKLTTVHDGKLYMLTFTCAEDAFRTKRGADLVRLLKSLEWV